MSELIDGVGVRAEGGQFTKEREDDAARKTLLLKLFKAQFSGISGFTANTPPADR